MTTANPHLRIVVSNGKVATIAQQREATKLIDGSLEHLSLYRLAPQPSVVQGQFLGDPLRV